MKNTRDYLRSQKITKKRRTRTLRLFIFYIVICLLFIGGIVAATHLQAMRIQIIEVEGNQVVPSAQLLEQAQTLIEGRYAYLIPKNNIMLYPAREIEASLKKEFPRISTVVVHAISLTKIQISIAERKPKSLWCKKVDLETDVDVSTDSGERCYFIDNEGYIFSLAPDFQGNSYLKFYGNPVVATSSEMLENPIGSQVLSSSTYAELILLSDNIQKANLPIAYITLEDKHNFSVRLVNNGKILFSDEKSLQIAYENLIVALQSEVFMNPSSKPRSKNVASTSETTIKNLAQFDYIDTRFGNKIFFKLRGAVAATTSTVSASSTTVQSQATSTVISSSTSGQ